MVDSTPATTATTTPLIGSCQDVANWQPENEGPCDEWVSSNYCTPGGGYGTGWNNDWGEFDLYKSQGLTVAEACCECGGGTHTPTPPTPTPAPAPCENIPVNWQPDGDVPCQDWFDENYCTSTGGYGTGWDASWGYFENYTDEGRTVVEACCQCGGGTTR